MYDVIVIGAGICGSFIAHKLAHYEGRFLVVEREHDVANGVTKANSAIVHTGYDPEDNTLKAELNVLGARQYERICKAIGADYTRCGAYILAHKSDGIAQLKVLEKRARARNIKCEVVDRNQIDEEHIADDIVAALSIPETAIINPWQVAIHLMEEAILNGVELQLSHVVTSIIHTTQGYQVRTQDAMYEGKIVINAAGCGAEKIASMIETSPFHITYKRGQYYVLSKQARGFVKHVLFPLPDAHGKGVLALPTTHGNTLLGPTAEVLPEANIHVSSEGLKNIQEHLCKIVKDVPYQEVIHSYSGVRPCGNDGDFYIKESKEHKKFFHVACIDSPGLASAPAIADYVFDTLLKHAHSWSEKTIFHKRKPHDTMNELRQTKANEIIKNKPAYGHIICRCEQISEGEIVDAIHRSCGARTIKDVKKRVRPGMGKCQGGFCEVEVAKILARELNIPLQDVLFDQENTQLGKEAK